MTLLGTTSLTVRTSLGVAALLALGACSSDSTEAASPTPQPTAQPTTQQTTESSSPTAQSPSATPAPSDSASPSQESSSDPTTAPSESPSSPPAPTPSAEPRLIAYAGGESAGVTVHTRADAKKLHGAPASFKAFVGRMAQHITDTEDCDAAAKGVTVQTLRTDGYAVGGVNDCGGYAALWALVDGRWKEIQGTQDSWKCQVLEQYAVPSDVAGTTCYDYKAQKQHHYHQD